MPTVESTNRSRFNIVMRAIGLSLVLMLLTANAPVTARQSGPDAAVKLLGSIQANKKRTGSIRGRVVDESGQPFAFAVVNVRPVNGTYEEEREVATNDQGDFQVTLLPPKPYKVHCYSSGYVEDADDGSSTYHLIGDWVTLRLRKGGVITGAVVNPSGEPVVNARVTAIRVRELSGRTISPPQEWGERQTDDRGIYRLYGLGAGSYLVRVDNVGRFEDNKLRNESPIYHPASIREGALEVKVSLGEEVTGINISYRRERGHIITGKCSASLRSGPSDDVHVELTDTKSGIVKESDWNGSKENRTFVFYGAPDGEYTLTAQDDADEPGAASLPHRITVRGRDVTGVELKLIPFGSIRGRVVLETPPKATRTLDCKPAREPLVEEAVVAALRHDNAKDSPASSGSVVSTPPDERGEFTLKRLPSGQYRLATDPVNEDLYVRSVNLPLPRSQPAQRNLLMLKPGEQITGLVITLAQGASSLRGRVVSHDEKEKLPDHLHAHLVPAERERADDPFRFAQTEVQSDGSIALTNLAPGRYRLLIREAPAADGSEESPASSWSAAGRAALRREAEVSNNVVELQPCQRVESHLTRYRPSPTKPSSRN